MSGNLQIVRWSTFNMGSARLIRVAEAAETIFCFPAGVSQLLHTHRIKSRGELSFREVRENSQCVQFPRLMYSESHTDIQQEVRV